MNGFSGVRGNAGLRRGTGVRSGAAARPGAGALLRRVPAVARLAPIVALVAALGTACARGGAGDDARLSLAGAYPSVTGSDAHARLDPVSLHPAIIAFGDELAADVAADSVGSIAATVVADGAVAWEGAFGLADRDPGTPATPATIYRVGSISKTVTALLLMRLVEDSVVALDDPVSRYLLEIERLAGRRATDRAITLRDLASHTAGLAREPASSRAARGRFEHWDRKVVASIPLTEAVRPPGEAYRYSNIGYGILGLALERAADRPFEDLVAEHILEPLGMTSSFYQVRGRHRERLAAGYVNLAGDSIDPRVPRAEHRGRGYKVPNGGLYSTVGDLARLVLALAGHPDHALLGDDALATMLTDHTPRPGAAPDPAPDPAAARDSARQAARAARQASPDPATPARDRAGYGLGLQLTRIGGTLLAGHSGSVAGYSAYLVVDPATASGVVLLRNYNRGATNLGAAAQRLLLELADERETEAVR